MTRLAACLALLPSLASAQMAVEIEYADPRDIPTICAARGRLVEVDSQIAGCQFWIGGTARIVIPAGAKFTCLYWHELRHVYEGDWHRGRKAGADEGCDWRPK